MQRFREHDEQLLRDQYLVYDDEAAVIQTSRDARNDLMHLFEADAGKRRHVGVSIEDGPGSAGLLAGSLGIPEVSGDCRTAAGTTHCGFRPRPSAVVAQEPRHRRGHPARVVRIRRPRR